MIMNMQICILVFAKDEKEAVETAWNVAFEIIGTFSEGGPFAGYADLTKDGLLVAEVEDRWGPLPPVLQVSTARFPIDDKRGLKFANHAMEGNRLRFKSNMEAIRHLIAKYTDDQLFDEVEGDEEIQIEGHTLRAPPCAFAYLCSSASGYIPSHNVHLYDFLGRTISRPEILQRILEDSDSNPWFVDYSEGQDPDWGPHIWNQPLWIVPFDAFIE